MLHNICLRISKWYAMLFNLITIWSEHFFYEKRRRRRRKGEQKKWEKLIMSVIVATNIVQDDHMNADQLECQKQETSEHENNIWKSDSYEKISLIINQNIWRSIILPSSAQVPVKLGWVSYIITANRHRQPPPPTARSSESTLLDFVGSWNSVWRVYST